MIQLKGKKPRKTEENDMKEYIIYYIFLEDGKEILGGSSGQGHNIAEAIEDFKFWHDDYVKIESVEFYKDLSR